MKRRISFSTPEGEVKGVDPVKFIARTELTAVVIIPSDSIATAVSMGAFHWPMASTTATAEPVKIPFKAKDRAGSQGNRAGTRRHPAAMPATTAAVAQTPRCHAAAREKT